jgi:hypothetical protein
MIAQIWVGIGNPAWVGAYRKASGDARRRIRAGNHARKNILEPNPSLHLTFDADLINPAEVIVLQVNG